MTSAVYEVDLATSGKLKLRAKGQLAEGTPDAVFEACVLLHEAARIQRLAVEALPVCPSATRLASSLEECWCYVEGRDPPRAAEAWGDVLRAREEVDAGTAEAMPSRLAPRYEASRRDFARMVNESPGILAIRDAGRLDGLAPPQVARARKELGHLLERFPGAVSFWWMAYRLAETAGDREHAWEALTQARRLSPRNPRFLAMSLLVAAWALPPAAAERHLASARSALDRAGAEVCLMYALAEITLARNAPAAKRAVRWMRARDAANTGIARATTDGTRRNLKATQLLLGELLAGRKPTMEILYLAGLGEVAATAKANTNVADFLTERLRRTSPDPGYRAAS